MKQNHKFPFQVWHVHKYYENITIKYYDMSFMYGCAHLILYIRNVTIYDVIDSTDRI